jgi:hypothetical protein
MNKVVFDDIAPEQEWTLENYVAAAVKYPHCPGWVVATVKPGVPPAPVDFKVAMSFILAAVKKDTETCNPRDILDEYLKVSPVAVGLGGVTVCNSGVALPSVAGFYLPEARKMDALPGWVSEAVAYQRTPSSNSTPGTAGITVTRQAEKSLCLTEQFFVCPVPSAFTSDAVTNSHALYDMYKAKHLKHKPNNTLAINAAQMSQEWADHGTRVVKNVTPDLNDLVYENDGHTVISMPVMKMQDNRVVTSETFYDVLAQHRAVRGADTKHVSSLTAGYYLGAMSRSLDKVMWQVVDLLVVLRAAKLQAVMFDQKDMNANVVAALVANDVKVYASSSRRVNSKLFTSIDLTRQKVPKNCLYYSGAYFSATAPTRTKKGVVGQPESEFGQLFDQFCDCEFLRMTHLYLMNYHEKVLPHIAPSIHCHAGHVILISKPAVKSQQCSIARHFARMTLANKYKTAFPVLRTPFGVVDTLCPAFLKDVGVKIAMNAVERKEADFGYIDFETQRVFDIQKQLFEIPQFMSTYVAEVDHVALEFDQQVIAVPDIPQPPDNNVVENGVLPGVVDEVEVPPPDYGEFKF